MGDAMGETRRGEITSYDVVRIVLGLVLLTAATFKGHQLATEPVAGTSLFTSSWFLIAVVQFELFLGLWLLCGLYTRWDSPAENDSAFSSWARVLRRRDLQRFRRSPHTCSRVIYIANGPGSVRRRLLSICPKGAFWAWARGSPRERTARDL